jgi:hypothetical protein
LLWLFDVEGLGLLEGYGLGDSDDDWLLDDVVDCDFVAVCDDVIVPDILLEAENAGVPVLLTELQPVFVSVTLEVLLFDKTAVPVTEPDDVLELVVVVEWVRVFV